MQEKRHCRLLSGCADLNVTLSHGTVTVVEKNGDIEQIWNN